MMRSPRALLLALPLSLALTGCATSTPSATATTTPTTPPTTTTAPIAWRPWDAAAFADAKKERKIIVVAVETEWCHWCHVMDERTWSDAAVRQLIGARYIAIREDADARPDLAEKYAEWGWPALAILSPDGEPVTELRGFQDKATFLPLLASLAAKLDKGERLGRVVPAAAPAARSARDDIIAYTRDILDGLYDEKEAGFTGPQKYPFYAPVEEQLLRAFLLGDDASRARALATADHERALIDPVDGGMYQYSLEGTWTAPHYEKLAEINGNALGTMALAYEAARAADDPRAPSFVAAGDLIARYVTTILRDPSSGAFYANQDADVGTRGDRPALLGKQYYALDAAGRAKAGAPFIDTHVYASHNGRVIAGLARFGAATGNATWVAAAQRAFDAVTASHGEADGGYRHEARGDGVAHLADDVAMGNAALELYDATGDARFRERARTIAAALLRLRASDGALRDHERSAAVFELEERKPLRGNAEAARFLLKLGRLDDDKALVDAAGAALDAFSAKATVDAEGRFVGEYLLALEEAKYDPLHFAVVTGGMLADDKKAAALYRAALDVYAPHRLIEVVKPGPRFPDLGDPALYLCGASFCSPPMQDPAIVAKKAKPFLKPRT